MKILTFLIVLFSTLHSETFYYEFGKKVTVTKIKDNRENVKDGISYYKNKIGQKIGVKNEIITKCKKSIDCKTVLKEYDFINIKNLTSKILLITLNENQDPFLISQQLYLDDKIEFAHPNFIKKKTRR